MSADGETDARAESSGIRRRDIAEIDHDPSDSSRVQQRRTELHPPQAQLGGQAQGSRRLGVWLFGGGGGVGGGGGGGDVGEARDADARC